MSQLQTSGRRFPIQDGPSVPWVYIAPHESQANRNHGQTLARLAERGGLGAGEAELLVTGQPLCPKSGEWDWPELKRRWVERAERVNNAYFAAPTPPPADPKPRRAWVMQLEIGADTREDLVSLLESMLFDSLKPGSDSSVTGGYSAGGYFTVTHDPDQTHDKYFADLEAMKSVRDESQGQ